MVKTVEITCPEDPLIEKHCRETFEAQFNEHLARSQFPDSENLRRFSTVLRKEARRQEWYPPAVPVWGDGDFVPRRYERLRDEDGQLQLLVPQVRIVDGR